MDENFPSDQHQEESEEKQKLQNDYRARVKAAAQLYHPLNTTEGLEASVLKLRDDLTRLRRGIKLWTAVVAGLLVLVVAISVWLLQSRQHSNDLANALNYEGKYTEAETEYRAVLKLREKVLGPGHADTLNTRSELANALDHEGKYAEAEAEYRAVLKLREEELGAEHPDP